MLECICLLPLNVDGLCILVCVMLSFLISAFVHFRVHGAVCPFCLVLVASSSSVGGSGTLQSGIRTKDAAWA